MKSSYPFSIAENTQSIMRRCGLHLFYFIVKGETKMSVTIEVRDGFGDSVSATVDPLTGFILVDLQDEEFYLDPKDPKSVAWLKKVFSDKLDFLRRE